MKELLRLAQTARGVDFFKKVCYHYLVSIGNTYVFYIIK